MLFGSTSQHIIDLVRTFGRSARSSIVRELQDAGGRWKYPSRKAYNDGVAKRRDYMRHRQLIHAERVLARHYPDTFERMIPHVVPFFAHLVDQLATRYRSAPRRELVAGRKALKQPTKDMRAVYEDALVDVEMRGADRTAAAVRVCLVRVGWDADEKRARLTRYWPDEVDVVCDPERPGDVRSALAVCAKVLSDSGVSGDDEHQVYEIWGQLERGVYRRIMVRANGEEIQPLELEQEEPYPYLPWFAVHFDDPEGMLFPPLPTDDLAAADCLTAGYTNRDHIIAMQAHAQHYVIGAEAEDAGTWRTGPDQVWTMMTGEVGSIQANPPLAAVQDALQATMERDLLLRGVSPAQATADPKYMAALTLRVLNQTRDERREASVPYAQEVERRQMWPAIRAVVEANGDLEFPADAEMRAQFGALSSPLEPAAEWDLSLRLVEANVSTLPAEMVKHNQAPNEDAALEKLRLNAELNRALADELQGRPEPKPGPPPPPPTEDEGEQDQEGAEAEDAA